MMTVRALHKKSVIPPTAVGGLFIPNRCALQMLPFQSFSASNKARHEAVYEQSTDFVDGIPAQSLLQSVGCVSTIHRLRSVVFSAFFVQSHATACRFHSFV